MKCLCYCTAAGYQIKPLLEFLQQNYVAVDAYRDVIHVKLKRPENHSDIFYFSYGCIVAFGISPEELEKKILIELKNFEQAPLGTPNMEIFQYEIGDRTHISRQKDLIIIEADEPLMMLAVSFALAQSIKLINYEEAVDKTIRDTAYIPQQLAERGEIKMKRKMISQYMGNLFLVRNSINLKIEFLGAPEFFWEYPHFEDDYRRAAVYLEIAKRVEILNKRLDVIHELFNMLTAELHHQHSSTLEKIIIWLISVEIILFVISQFLLLK